MATKHCYRDVFEIGIRKMIRFATDRGRGSLAALTTHVLSAVIVLAAAISTLAHAAVFTDLASFEAATGPLVKINFENQPNTGSSNCTPFDRNCTPIANPLLLVGASFTDPFTLQTGFCSSPTCQPDPNNPSGGNIVLALNPGGTISFPAGSGGAMLVVEGIGANPFQVKVTDFSGNTSVAGGIGVLFGVSYLGFTAPRGISRIELLSVGGTGGPLALSAVLFDNPPQATQGIVDAVNNLVSTGVLPHGQGNALTASLKVAVDSLNRRNTASACNQLQAFINKVNALVSTGGLTPTGGQALIDTAADIRRELGCR